MQNATPRMSPAVHFVENFRASRDNRLTVLMIGAATDSVRDPYRQLC
jgi:hypothetical protein